MFHIIDIYTIIKTYFYFYVLTKLPPCVIIDIVLWTGSSAGQSNALLRRGSDVRIVSGSPKLFYLESFIIEVQRSWQRAWFGTMRSQVRSLSPRPYKMQKVLKIVVFNTFYFYSKLFSNISKKPKNSLFIIQDYLKLFRLIQCYNVFPRVFPRQVKKYVQEKLIFHIYCVSSISQIF